LRTGGITVALELRLWRTLLARGHRVIGHESLVVVISVAYSRQIVSLQVFFREEHVLPVVSTPVDLLPGVRGDPSIFTLASHHVPLELLVGDDMLTVEGTPHLEVSVEVHREK
jgi:hypothetical protein